MVVGWGKHNGSFSGEKDPSSGCKLSDGILRRPTGWDMYWLAVALKCCVTNHPKFGGFKHHLFSQICRLSWAAVLHCGSGLAQRTGSAPYVLTLGL